MRSRFGQTVIFVTHDVREALMLGDRIALKAAGKIVLLATRGKFVRSSNPHVRAYLETLRNDFVIAP